MGDVIEIPTQLKMMGNILARKRIRSKAVDGSVLLEVGDVELWFEIEEAAEIINRMESAVSEAFLQLRDELEDKNGRE